MLKIVLIEFITSQWYNDKTVQKTLKGFRAKNLVKSPGIKCFIQHSTKNNGKEERFTFFIK